MRLMRSLFFGGLAMLAAALCMSAPATAADYSPAVYTLHIGDFDYEVPVVMKVEAIAIGITNFPVITTAVPYGPAVVLISISSGERIDVREAM